jgi:DNA-binding transcriptional regulator GbsR (MarR family)
MGIKKDTKQTGKHFKTLKNKKERQNKITPGIKNSMFYDIDGFWKIFNDVFRKNIKKEK